MSAGFRGYQQHNFEELGQHTACGLDPLLVAGCGYGKGFIISRIVDSVLRSAQHSKTDVSIIFAVHGISLCIDMSGRIGKLGIPHGILVGGKRRERWHPVQVASIDTLARMEHPPKADLFIIDEAHLALSPIWRKTLDKFPNARRIGCTATPLRLDRKGLGKKTGGLFDVMVLGPSVLDLIKDGFLVRSRVLEPPPIEGSREVKLGPADNLGAQAAVFDKVKLIGDEIRHYKQYARGRKGVTFCTDQKHAFHVAEQFTQSGIPWVYVDANTPLGDEKFPKPGTRAHIYRDLDAANGNLMGISNVGITQIGWDHSIVSYLGVMRRTGSFALWHQMMGRGSRIHPEKNDFLIIDHAGNTQLHAPMGYFESPIEWSLDGEAVKSGDPVKNFTIQTCKQSVLDCSCGRTENHDPTGAHLACYATFRPGPVQCPFCGCPILKKERKIETVDSALVELQRPMFQVPLARQVAALFQHEADVTAATVKRLAEKRKQLDYLLRQAERNGHKSGTARHRYAARFGEYPPRDWMPAEWRDSHVEELV